MGKPPSSDKNGLKKGPWTAEEDQKLIDYIQKHGHGRWRTLPKNAGLQRCGKSCRLRWTNYLRPDIKRGKFSFEEEETIIQLHSILGNKWSAIAARLPGRTDNEIKNYWNTHIRKRLLRMGIDPVTHGPRLDLLDLSSILNPSLYNSSQLNVPNLFDIQAVANPNLLNLATALLSSQCISPQILPQSHQENQLVGNPQLVQNQEFQSPIQEFQACTTSNASNVSFLNDTQLMQANVEQFFPNPTNFSFQKSPPNVFQNNVESSNLAQSFCFLPEYRNQSNIDLIMRNQMLHSSNSNNMQNLGFGSVLSTPSSSSTPLNSSSTTYVNGSTEDERDSYCSNMLMFDMPNSLDVNGFM